jgi:hypothetical protein
MQTRGDKPMASEDLAIQFEDVPLEEARRMGRGPRMDPALYQALKQKIQTLDGAAARLALPEGISSTTMKNRLLRVAADTGVPLTVRRVPGGLLFWRSTPEDIQQASEVAGRLQATRKGRQEPPTPPQRRRRKA